MKPIYIIIAVIILLLYIFSLSYNTVKLFHVNKKKIAIFILFRNNINYLPYFISKMIKLEKIYDIEYYIYENNSNDGTKKKLADFMKNRMGKLISININNLKKFKKINSERGETMAFLRNENKKSAKNITSNYVFVIDSEVYFNNDIFKKMIKLIDNNPDYGLITPFDICLTKYRENLLPHYYDSFAMILKNGISYKDNNNTCMFKNCKYCNIKRKKNENKKIHKYLLNRDKLSEVNCAFGGLVIIKPEIFNKVSWGPTICEHHFLCNKIRQLNKKIIIDPTISVITNGKDNKKVNLQKIQAILNKYNI